MEIRQTFDALQSQAWLEQPAQIVQSIVKGIYRAAGSSGHLIANTLYGTWFGHPLHPAITDIPSGAWTAGMLLDAAELLGGGRAFGLCADATIAIGVAGGIGAVLSGLTDWQHTSERPRRLGLVHGVLNISATVLYGVSLALRARGRRRYGQAVAGLGYATTLAADYMGSDLIDLERIGVDHTAGQVRPTEFTPVLPVAELAENEMREVHANGFPVLLARRHGTIYALPGTCTHMGAPLAEGRLIDDSVQCPWHASRFALSDGRVLDGPATYPERCLSTRIRNGQIEVGPSPRLGRCEHAQVPVSRQEFEREAVPVTAMP